MTTQRVGVLAEKIQITTVNLAKMTPHSERMSRNHYIICVGTCKAKQRQNMARMTAEFPKEHPFLHRENRMFITYVEMHLEIEPI
jgi:hypothetical protein